jgi:7-cyano-7-deazaguanine synthase
LRFAQKCADDLEAEFAYIDLTSVGAQLTGSALTDDSVPVPQGHYAAESMKATVVPNRNMIMLSIATGIAVARGASTVSTAVHAGDHAIYPDCRPTFISLMSQTAQIATEGFHAPGFSIEAPFVNMTKAEICQLGADLGVPWENTWSCYEGRALHCGKCGTCVERHEAFMIADVFDPTRYEVEM